MFGMQNEKRKQRLNGVKFSSVQIQYEDMTGVPPISCINPPKVIN